MKKIHEPGNLIDAQGSHFAHPTKFACPEREDLQRLLAGDTVKIGVGNPPAQPAVPERGVPAGATGERFWVMITSVNRVNRTPVSFVGTIENELVYTNAHGLRADDLIRFEPRHILEIGT